MSTNLTGLAVQRFTRTVSSGLATNTEWLGLMAANAAALAAAPWLESPSAAATLPVNDPTRSFAGATAYDAWKQSGDASTGTGRQCAYAGMAAYRVALPAPLTVQSVSVRLAADKFCVGGLSLVAVESDAATPEAAWNGAYAGADAVRQTGLLAETAEKVSASTNRSGVVTLDLSDVSGTHSAVWLLLALADYTAARREYWIEGSGCIDAQSIEVVVAEDVPADEDARPPIPLEIVPCASAESEGAPPILAQRAWIAYNNPRILRGVAEPESLCSRLCAAVLSGAAAAAASGGTRDADPPSGFRTGRGARDESDQPDTIHCSARADSTGADASSVAAAAAAVYLVDRALAGRRIRVPVRATDGEGLVRIVLVESATPDVSSIDWTDEALLAGGSAACLGCADAAAAAAGSVVYVPIRRDAAERFGFLLMLPVSVAAVGPDRSFAIAPININSLLIT